MSTEKPRANLLVSLVRNYVLPIVIGGVVAVSLRHWVVSAAEVVSGSMLPGVPYPSYLVVDRAAVRIGHPYRGEVIIFHHPPKSVPADQDPLVKRIIGLPGETVTIHDGHVFINNQLLNEPYLKVATVGTFGPFHVPADSYFVMGDNRQHSFDSRYWETPYVPSANIIGRIDAIVWPLSDARFVH